MKKCIINNQEAEAVQYIDPTPCPGEMIKREVTDKSIADIKELLKGMSSTFKQKQGVLSHYLFSINDDKRSYLLYHGDWVVKTKNSFFIVSDDIFKDMFTEVE